MSDPADLSDRLPPFGFRKKTIRWIGFTALASILTPTLVIGAFLGFVVLRHETPPDPGCLAEGIRQSAWFTLALEKLHWG
jgi:hypothetical protein